ncbi:hypothetical protein GCM10009730_62020 [Streptomyces albidochromogenes]
MRELDLALNHGNARAGLGRLTWGVAAEGGQGNWDEMKQSRAGALYSF